MNETDLVALPLSITCGIASDRLDDTSLSDLMSCASNKSILLFEDM